MNAKEGKREEHKRVLGMATTLQLQPLAAPEQESLKTLLKCNLSERNTEKRCAGHAHTRERGPSRRDPHVRGLRGSFYCLFMSGRNAFTYAMHVHV